LGNPPDRELFHDIDLDRELLYNVIGNQNISFSSTSQAGFRQNVSLNNRAAITNAANLVLVVFVYGHILA